ncbi:MAG: hypothetical protein H0V10_06685 [Geodermatophilaceae bacterium]|nr:hypothetical protein [Geodermatophilaceae bacterium]
MYSERRVPLSGGQAFLFKDSYQFEEVWKEDSSGDVLLQIRGRYVVEETSADRVPKSQVPPAVIPEEGLIGPVHLFTQTGTGTDVVRDADGKTLYVTAGVLIIKHLFGTAGDSMPGGTSLAADIVRVVGPHPLLDVDLCDVAEEQTT